MVIMHCLLLLWFIVQIMAICNRNDKQHNKIKNTMFYEDDNNNVYTMVFCSTNPHMQLKVVQLNNNTQRGLATGCVIKMVITKEHNDYMCASP